MLKKLLFLLFLVGLVSCGSQYKLQRDELNKKIDSLELAMFQKNIEAGNLKLTVNSLNLKVKDLQNQRYDFYWMITGRICSMSEIIDEYEKNKEIELIKRDSIQVDTLKFRNGNATFIQYTLTKQDKSTMLFNQVLQKRNIDIRKKILKEYDETYNWHKSVLTDEEMYYSTYAWLNSTIKFLSDNAFSIAFGVVGYEYRPEAWNIYDNYIIKNGRVIKVEFSDLFLENIDLNSMSYNYRTGEINDYKVEKSFGLNFENLLKKSPEYYYNSNYGFYFSEQGIRISYPDYSYARSRFDKAIEYSNHHFEIEYYKLKPYLKQDVIKILTNNH